MKRMVLASLALSLALGSLMCVVQKAEASTPAPKPPVQQVVNGIKVKYGKHTYASKNQAEYDKVMSIVDASVKGYSKIVFGGEFANEYNRYLAGDRASNYGRRDALFRGLTYADQAIGDLVEAKVKREDIVKAYSTAILTVNTFKNTTDPGNGTPVSAYDALVRLVSDCDADAQVISAVFDSMGYNTMIVSGSYHADPLVNINGVWYKPFGNAMVKYEVQKDFTKAGLKIISQPTNGVMLR